METIIKQLREKVKSIDNSTKENRARKGAYVDCIVMIKQIIDYKTYYKLSEQFKVDLEKYAIENDCVNDQYYTALKLLSEISQRAYRSDDYLQIAGRWFNRGMTLELKEALSYTSYKDDNIVHFNAMSLMDAVSACA
jgi:hypothetical protein